MKMPFHIRLLQIRNARKLKQSDVCHMAGMNQACYSKIERGERDPRLSTVIRIASALGVSLDDLTASAFSN